MSKQVVALSIDKVQTFLFEVIHAHEQEKQTEEATLKNIRKSSHEISKGFLEEVSQVFHEDLNSAEKSPLLGCSGVVIFNCELSREDIEERLSGLFFKYYCDSQGQKLLKYTCFQADTESKLAQIQEAKKRLKESTYFNKIIERHQEKLFSFQTTTKKPQDSSNEFQELPLFVQGINDLYSAQEQSKKREYKKNHFRIVVIKADLDGMGDMFRKVDDYDRYKKISDILNKWVSLQGLHCVAEKCSPQNSKAWIFPFYIAGDDIFFAVSVANLTRGIDVCREMLKIINKELADIPERIHIKPTKQKKTMKYTSLTEPKKLIEPSGEDDAKPIELTISIGIDIVFNREPVRYYLDLVETQLKYAKKAMVPKKLPKEYLHGKIAINGLTYFDIDCDLFKEKERDHKKCKSDQCKEKKDIEEVLNTKPVWSFFVNDAKQLHDIQSQYAKKMGTTSFLYSLLARLTEESCCNDDIKYINNLFYSLLPKYLDDMDDKLRNAELLFKKGIIKNLYLKKEEGYTLILNAGTKHRLETYLRLMLLFSDPRFNPIEDKSNDNKFELNEEWASEVHDFLFAKPLDYLYKEILHKKNGEDKLLGIFVKGMERKKNNQYKKGTDEKQTRISYYQRLRIGRSLFFKLRETEKVSIEKAADMIEVTTPEATRVNAINQAREKEKKTIYLLEFEKNKFCQEAQKSGRWTPDYIDSLMLFYQYDEMAVKFKRLYPKSDASIKETNPKKKRR